MDRSLALQALSAVCNANITPVTSLLQSGGHQAPTLSIQNVISTVLDYDAYSEVSAFHVRRLQDVLQGGGGGLALPAIHCTPQALKQAAERDATKRKDFVIDEGEFFDPRFDYDYTRLKDTQVYYRGGEVYERPCGWYRFALKVLNKYPDGNTWLGTYRSSTLSDPGEWPVSYHGTSMSAAAGIIDGHYEPGNRQLYGRGIYSTPHMSEAISYSKVFVSKKDGKKYRAVLQNRINAQYRKKFYHDKYWVIPIPKGTSDEKEEVLVERAIRPYGLLIKPV